MIRISPLLRLPVAGIGLATLLAAAAIPFPVEAPAREQAAAKPELPIELQYVPADAAIFISLDAALVWDHPLLKAIRKADAKTFEDLTTAAKLAFGISPDDVKKAVLFIPSLHLDNNPTGFEVVVTFKNAYDKEKIAKGASMLLPKDAKVVAVNDRTVLVMVNLGDEFAKPQPAGAPGPLTQTLQAAASGKHSVVLGMTPDNLPAIFRSDELPPGFRPFQPLFKSVAFSATVDAGKSFNLDVRVKTATAGQAVECEKSLGVLLDLIKGEIAEEIKKLENDAAQKPSSKDFITTMQAVSTAIKDAKFSTLGNETQLTLSLTTELPFTATYLAAKEKMEGAKAARTSSNNLRQIALALHNCSFKMNNNMPPAAICDKTGKPLLSWRVIILPFIEEEKLYQEFKLDEPWDSDHNKKLLAKMPKVYAIPGVTKPDGTETHYRVFVGNGAGFDLIKAARFPQDFPDGTSNTIMCVTAAKAVPWTKPEELEFDPEKDMRKLLGTVVNGHVQVSMFDGSTRGLGKDISKETLHAAITRAGGEVLGPDFE